MTAKCYLQQIWIINQKIKRLMMYREQLRQDMYSLHSPSTDGDRVQTSSTGDGMLRMIAKVDEAERDIVAETNRLLRKREAIIGQIDKLSELDIKPENAEKYKTLLFERHVMFWSWEEISKAMGYSERQIHRLKYEAWDAFSLVMEKDGSQCQ